MSANQASLKWFCLDENKTCWFPGDMHQINSYDKHTLLVYLFFVYSKSSSTAICSLASNFVDNGVVVNLSRSHDAAESFLLFIPTQRKSRKYFLTWGSLAGWLSRGTSGFRGRIRRASCISRLLCRAGWRFYHHYHPYFHNHLIATSHQLGQSCQCKTGSLAGWWNTPTNARSGGGSPIFKRNDNTVKTNGSPIWSCIC